MEYIERGRFRPADPGQCTIAIWIEHDVRMRTWVLTSIRTAGWAPILVFTSHLVASRGLEAYHDAPWLDIPMHFMGGVAIAYFFWRSVTSPAAGPVLGAMSAFGNVVLTLALTCTSTVVWEFAEWTTDRLGWTHAQGGLDDTILDMLLGISGGATFLVLALLHRRAV